jgi:vancomycin aglycone glucosyltransferase
MRVLLSTIGSRGDVQPLVALASQLRSLGQEIRLCVPPDFREWIEGLGMPVTPIGPEVRKLVAAAAPAAATKPMSFTPEQRRQMVEGTVAAQFETLTTIAHDCDVIVAANALQIAARSVAEKHDISYVFAAYSPNVLPSPHHAPPPTPIPGQPPAPATTDNRELWARDTERFNTTWGALLNARRAALGLAAVDDVRGHIFGDQPWLAADPTLAPWPDPDDSPVFQSGAWLEPDERPLSRELEAFLDAGAAPVYFGFGSMRAPHDLAQVMIHAARALGRRAIVSRGWADLSPLDHDASGCLVIDEVNQQALFRRVAAVVHHGGAGTTHLAAMAGAPQVIIPQIYDQHYWATRLDDLGIGCAHAPGAPTAESLTAALDRALGKDIAAGARSIATAMRRDGARIAAERVIASAG